MFQYMKFERMTAFFEQQEEGKQKKLLASSAILSMLGLLRLYLQTSTQ
jgi:hypothetical protein